MKIKDFIYWVVLVICLMPPVSAQYPDTQYTYAPNNYLLAAESQEATDVSVSGTVILNKTFTNIPLADAELLASGLFIRLTSVATIVQGGDGQWGITVTVNGVEQPSCQWDIPTRDPGGFLAGDFVTYFTRPPVACIVPVPQEELYDFTTYYVNVTATIEEGTPSPIDHIDTNLIIEREDVYVIPQDLTGMVLQDYLPATIFVIALIWSLQRNYRMPAIAATLGVAASFVPMDFTHIGAFMLFVLFIWVTYYTVRKDKNSITQE